MKETNIFKAGDRVKTVVGLEGWFVEGEKGVVCFIGGVSIGVRFDNPSNGRHTCNGTCTNKQGWYVLPEHLVLDKAHNIKLFYEAVQGR
jgi:hypothetical protein